jgi:hypothetical protein
MRVWAKTNGALGSLYRSQHEFLPARAPSPAAMTSPSCGFSLAVSGMMMPPFVYSSPSMRRMTTRSWYRRRDIRIIERFRICQ